MFIYFIAVDISMLNCICYSLGLDNAMGQLVLHLPENYSPAVVAFTQAVSSCVRLLLSNVSVHEIDFVKVEGVYAHGSCSFIPFPTLNTNLV